MITLKPDYSTQRLISLYKRFPQIKSPIFNSRSIQKLTIVHTLDRILQFTLVFVSNLFVGSHFSS